MIVHQQLAALAGGKSSKKLIGTELPVYVEEGDPLFNPNHPNTSSTVRKKKKSKKLKADSKKTVMPQPQPAKKPTSK